MYNRIFFYILIIVLVAAVANTVMARSHAKATPPGQPTIYIPFTAQEELERDAEEALPPPPPPTDEERIDAAFPQTDVARVIFDTLFEMINRVRVLEGNAVITRAQFKTFLKAKLP